MVWRIASGLVLTLALEHVLSLDQVESSEDAMMLLQTRAKITKHTSLLEREDAEDYIEDDAEEDEWEEVDAEQEMAEAAQWAGGYKQCPSPKGARSGCKVIGGGKGFAASARLCAQKARAIGADTFEFLRRGAKCWVKRCKNVNMQYKTEGPGTGRNWKIYSKYCGLERVHTEIESECGPGLFTNYLKFPAPPAETCANALSFTGMKSNNLNGFGPGDGAEVFRFANVLPDVDLIVQADDNYRPVNSSQNGVHKKMGRLNMASGTETAMLFKFVESRGQNPVKVDSFLFTVYDIDQGARCTSQMTVNASQYSAYFVDPETELIVKTDIGGPSWPASSSFTSSQKGNGRDNPRFPRRLSPTQRARAVTFEYQSVKFFRMGFKMGPGKGGRNILFGGISSLTEEFCPFNGHPNRNAGTDPEAAQAASGEDR